MNEELANLQKEHLKQVLQLELENLVKDSKNKLGEIKTVALSEAWKFIQLAVSKFIQTIEYNTFGMVGTDKKIIALEYIDKFYNATFVMVSIPFVPPFVASIIHRYTKTFLLILAGSTIDAMVATFRELGIFYTTKRSNL